LIRLKQSTNGSERSDAIRKRITPEMLAEINDYIIGRKKKDDDAMILRVI
jgi:hypothetical protein